MAILKMLGEWSATQSANHSPAAITNASHVIEDAVACMIGGAGDKGSSAIRSGISGFGSGKASVVGSSERMSGPWAAFANGAAAHALDYDDTFLPGVNHASAVLVPALFALGEEVGSSGSEVIDAYIVGLEVMYFLARGVMRSHYDVGWHTTSTIGTIGAAAACARLLKLGALQSSHAMSLGVSLCGGMKVQFGTPAKPMHAGMAAQHGIQAARLAQAGVEGRLEALEGNMGFLALCGGPAAVGWESLAGQVGVQPLAIEARGLMVKRYPCCASTHRILDCLLELREEHKFEAKDVAAVRTFIGYGNSRNLMYDNPVTELQARFSMQYCVAVGLRYGAVGLRDFTPSAVRREEVRELFKLTSVTAFDPTEEQKNTDKMKPHRLEVELKDGRVLSRERDLPRGTLKYPLTDADRKAKFDDCCSRFLPAPQLTSLYRRLLNLSSEDSIAAVASDMAHLAGSDEGERFETNAG
jgi:2-methylcitrate dehydratase PrpD